MALFAILLPILIHRAIAAEFIHRSSGGYQVQWKELAPCPPKKRGTNEIFADVRLTKRRQGVTEMTGKYIFLVPFDDNITMNIDFAILNSNLAWLPSTYNVPVVRACTSMTNILREGWTEYIKSMGISPKCPIPKGVYELKGYDVNHILRSNIFPKEFLYGRYKLTVEYWKSKKLVGCAYAILQIVPALQKGPKKN